MSRLTRLPDDVHRIISTFYQAPNYDPPLVQVSEDNKIRIRVEHTKEGLVRYCVHSLPRALLFQRCEVKVDLSTTCHFTHDLDGGNDDALNLWKPTIGTNLFQKWITVKNWYSRSSILFSLIKTLNSQIQVRESDQAIRYDNDKHWMKPFTLLPSEGYIIVE